MHKIDIFVGHSIRSVITYCCEMKNRKILKLKAVNIRYSMHETIDQDAKVGPF